MHRFLVSIPLVSTLEIPQGDLYHQIAHVFRAKKGDRMIFFVPFGVDTVYEVIDINKKKISLSKKEEKKIFQKKNNRNIHIFQAYPNKVSTIELIVQKLVEVGIKKVTFFPSDHSQMKDLPEQKKTRL